MKKGFRIHYFFLQLQLQFFFSKQAYNKGGDGKQPCLQDFRQSMAQIILLSYTDWLEYWNIACIKKQYHA